MAPVAGQTFDPGPSGSSHVHPNLSNAGELSQHQAIHSCVRGRAASRQPKTQLTREHTMVQTGYKKTISQSGDTNTGMEFAFLICRKQQQAFLRV
ncbi:UNVERIFIED_CONTAM: hypothetical protein FKN15_027668 [Acipenser sinensis]